MVLAVLDTALQTGAQAATPTAAASIRQAFPRIFMSGTLESECDKSMPGPGLTASRHLAPRLRHSRSSALHFSSPKPSTKTSSQDNALLASGAAESWSFVDCATALLDTF